MFVNHDIFCQLLLLFFLLQTKITLGNLDAFRDWGFAGDYVKGMWMMMNHHTADDWVLATGESHSVREFLEIAFNLIDLNYEEYVLISEKYQRPNEVTHLLGDYSKAKKELGWKPETSFAELVKIMIEHDLKLAEQEKTLINNNLLKPTWEYSV